MAHRKKIVLDCERMKYPYTGLYHYCAHLAQALVELDPEHLCFYIPEKLTHIFGEHQCYIRQKSRHKAMMPALKDVAVWHSTHQSTDYFPKKRKVRIVLTVHDLNYLYDESKSQRKKGKYLRELQQKVDRADHIVTISEFTRTDVLNNLKLAPEKISVIYNGCNVTQVQETVRPAAAPASPFLFTIGTIVEKKNFHVIPALLQNNDLKLVIAGITHSEAYKEKILQEAAAYGARDRIFFTGPITENDKQWYYQHCQAFVFPSISEGFGLPVIEAMYFGKPVFLSTHTCLPEIGGAAAYYFESFDAISMQTRFAEGMEDFASNDRAVAVKERASMFNWEDSAKQYLDVYQALL